MTADGDVARIASIVNDIETQDHADQSAWRCRQLAMQWPSLAAAVGELLKANDEYVPPALRAAMRIMATEKNSHG